MTQVTLKNYKETCLSFKSEKCQNFYKDPLKYFPICGDNPEIKQQYHPILLETAQLLYELKCQTDEKGELCPTALSSILHGNNNIFVLDDTCKSKICTESAIKIYKSFDKQLFSNLDILSATNETYSYSDLTKYKKIIKILESDE
eukprot:jgi/Orpsp1_1/1185009/evm.model.c7180000091935.1